MAKVYLKKVKTDGINCFSDKYGRCYFLDKVDNSCDEYSCVINGGDNIFKKVTKNEIKKNTHI